MFDASYPTPFQLTQNYPSLHQRSRLSSLLAEGKLIPRFEGLDVGDRVSVQLMRLDVERGFIDFTERDEDRGIETRLFEKAQPMSRCFGTYVIFCFRERVDSQL